MTPQRLVELLVRREEGLLTDEEHDELVMALRDDPKLRRAAAAQYALVTGLADAVGSPSEPLQSDPRAPLGQRARSRRSLVGLALAGAALLGGVAVLLPRLLERGTIPRHAGPAPEAARPAARTPPGARPLLEAKPPPSSRAVAAGTGARLDGVVGSVRLVRDGTPSPGAAGVVVGEQQGLETQGQQSRASLLLGDGARILIGANTRIDSISEAGHRVLLDQGRVSLERPASPAAGDAAEIVVVTAKAEVRVGASGNARAQIIATLGHTRLEVYEGEATLRRFSNGATNVISAGGQALVTEAAAEPPVAGAGALVGHWRFDEGSGGRAGDSSSWNNQGTLAAGTAWIAQGKTGGALVFDGQRAAVRVGDPANESLDMATSDFTITAWVKTSATGYRAVVNKRAKGGGTGYGLRIVDGRASFYIRDETDGRHKAASSRSANYNDGLWHHVAVVAIREHRVVFYKDGSADGESAIEPERGSIDNSYPLVIGAIEDASEPFEGLIDDVRVYKRALSAHEILSLVGGGE